jgi:hypothetical protein
MSSENVSQLLGDVAVAVGGVRAARNRFADRLAPDFSVFDYLRSDEMGLSNCIAGLLDPRGSHGQGGIFLDTFFSVLLNQKEWRPNYENCSVVTEQQANGMRRIDIVLRFSDAIVGIENKPWAGDQDEQLSDYATHLDKEADGKKKWMLVYLCDRDPSVRSLPIVRRNEYETGGNFIQCSFEQVETWLDLCSKNAKALPVRVFIEELSKFVRMRVRGVLDMSEEKETTIIILKSPRNLEAAFDVFNSFVPAKVELLDKFRKELQAELEASGFHLVWDESLSNLWGANSGFGVRFLKEQNIYLRFEFEGSGLGRLFWGLKSDVEKEKHHLEKWTSINTRMANSSFGSGGSPVTEIWWPWFRIDTKNHLGFDRNWCNNVQPWLQLMNGMPNGKRVASHIVSLACDVRSAMGDDIALLSQVC